MRCSQPVPSYRVVDPPYHPDRVRAQLAYLSLGLLTLALVFLAIRVLQGDMDTREFAEIVLPILTGIVGSACGFYFGRQGD